MWDKSLWLLIEKLHEVIHHKYLLILACRHTVHQHILSRLGTTDTAVPVHKIIPNTPAGICIQMILWLPYMNHHVDMVVADNCWFRHYNFYHRIQEDSHKYKTHTCRNKRHCWDKDSSGIHLRCPDREAQRILCLNNRTKICQFRQRIVHCAGMVAIRNHLNQFHSDFRRSPRCSRIRSFFRREEHDRFHYSSKGSFHKVDAR